MIRIALSLACVTFSLPADPKGGQDSPASERLATELTRAKSGRFESMYFVGSSYVTDGKPENDKDGLRWLELASEGGDLQANALLGETYAKGRLVKRDMHKAMLNLRIAAEGGLTDARIQLYRIYYNGELVPTDNMRAIKWAYLAQHWGSKTARNDLRRMKADIDKPTIDMGRKAAAAWLRSRRGNTTGPLRE